MRKYNYQDFWNFKYLTDFLNEHCIKPEDIVSIINDTDRIWLIWIESEADSHE